MQWEGDSSSGVFGRVNALRAAVVLVVLALALSTVGLSSVARYSADEAVDHVPGELLVKFKSSATDSDKANAKSALDAKVLKANRLSGVDRWRLGEGVDVDKALKELSKDKYADVIELAEPNWLCSIDAVPTDSLRGDLWSMHNLGQTGGAADADIDMYEAWASPQEAADVVVAVLDTGVNYDHPDLDGVIWTNSAEANGQQGVDDDGNGYVDDIHGYDFRNGDGDPMDDHGHGSHCSGVIAAEHDGSGVAGVMNGHIRIMACKWLSASGSGDVADAIEAIEYAASFEDANGDKVVRITSNSWGASKGSRTLQSAIAASGALFVASAGNSGSSRAQYPAGYNLDNIISVAATDHADGLASFSNYGSWVDLAAPGVNILSCDDTGGYLLGSGTSMSAPHVAGAAALVMSHDSTLTLAQVKAAILDNVEPESSLSGKVVTDGKLNVKDIFGLSELGGDSTSPGAITLSATGEGMTSIDLGWTAVGDDGTSGTAYLYDVRYDDCAASSFSWASADRASREPAPHVSGSTEAFTVEGLAPDTTYSFAIAAMDECGNAGAASDPVEATTEAPKWAVDSGVDPSATDVFYFSSAIDDGGNPAFVYSSSTGTWFSYLDANGDWQQERLTEGESTYPDLAYDGSTWWVVVGKYGWSVGKRTGTDSWTFMGAPDSKITADQRCIEALGPDHIGVCYRGGPSKSNGMKYAEYDGTDWTVELVDKGAAARYSTLEFDSEGDPGIVYCDSTGSGWLDICNYAHRDSSGTWAVETLLSGTIGHGCFPDLKYDADDNPHLVCDGGGVNYLHFDGTDWVYDLADGYSYACEASLVLVGSIVYVAYAYDYDVKCAKLDEHGWTSELVEDGSGTFGTRLDHDAGSDTLHLGYRSGGVVRHAVRDVGATAPEWG